MISRPIHKRILTIWWKTISLIRYTILFSPLFLWSYQWVTAQCDTIKEEFALKALEIQYTQKQLAFELVSKAIDSLKSFDNIECKKALVTSYLVKGVILRNQSKYQEALETIDSAAKLSKSIQDWIGLTKATINTCIVKKEQGDYQGAIAEANKSIDFLTDYRGPKDDHFIQAYGSAIVNATNIFIETESYPQVEDYYRKAEKVLKQSKLGRPTLEDAKLNYGIALVKNSKFELAQRSLDESYNYFNNQRDSFSLALVEYFRGKLHFAQQNYFQAKHHLSQSVSLYQTFGYPGDANEALQLLAQIYLTQKQAKQALAVLQQVRLDSSSAQLADQIALTKNYVQIYQQMGSTDLLLTYLWKLNAFSEEALKIRPLDYNLIQEKQALKEKIDRVKLDKKYKEKIGRFTMVGLSIIGLLSLIIYIVTKKKEEQQQKNKEQAVELENRSQEQKYQGKINQILKFHLPDYFLNKERINQILHDEVCTPLAYIKKRLELYVRTADQSVVLQTIDLIDNPFNAAKNLISGDRSTPQAADWLQNIILLVDWYKHNGPFKMEEHINVEPLDDIPLNVGHEIGIISTVLLDNVEVHADAQEVGFDLFRENGSLLLIIHDNGIGFDPNHILPQTSSQNSGIGLTNTKKRVQKIGGDLNIDSTLGKGTTITIEIPLNLKDQMS